MFEEYSLQNWLRESRKGRVLLANCYCTQTFQQFVTKTKKCRKANCLSLQCKDFKWFLVSWVHTFSDIFHFYNWQRNVICVSSLTRSRQIHSQSHLPSIQSSSHTSHAPTICYFVLLKQAIKNKNTNLSYS